jgi:UDP-N-acetylmuramoyl-L-alanyl-D-glutamate--2,6-diaminopimelate ligase
LKIALPNQPYEYITDNSNDVDAKTAFIQTAQNRRYADQAVTKGCHSVVPLADVKSFFGLDRIKVIGITGTNGKTTTAAAIYSILLD